MKRLSLWILIVSGSVQAADFSQGQVAFNSACARCHVAQAPATSGVPTLRVARDRNLVEQIRGKSLNAVRQWIADPWKIQSKAACDPRGISKSQIEDVLTYLVTLQKPLPVREDIRIQQERGSLQKGPWRHTPPASSSSKRKKGKN